MKTFSPKPSDIKRAWWVVDADGQVLGRLAAEIATLLKGKHKPVYAPHADTGDYVIVVNAKAVKLTGNKREQKMYVRHSGYPGGITQVPYAEFLEKRSATAVEKAVKGMLPHNRLGRAMLKKLKVYEGPEHPHGSQNPTTRPLTGQRKGA